MYFQNFLELLSSDTVPKAAPKCISIAILYVLLIVNIPFAVEAHTSLSSSSLELSAIPCIMSTSWGRNKCWISSVFHVPSFAFISVSAVAFEGKIEGEDATL